MVPAGCCSFSGARLDIFFIAIESLVWLDYVSRSNCCRLKVLAFVILEVRG